MVDGLFRMTHGSREKCFIKDDLYIRQVLTVKKKLKLCCGIGLFHICRHFQTRTWPRPNSLSVGPHVLQHTEDMVKNALLATTTRLRATQYIPAALRYVGFDTKVCIWQPKSFYKLDTGSTEVLFYTHNINLQHCRSPV